MSRLTYVIVQKINILIGNQCVVDFCASLMAILMAVVEVDGNHMSPSSATDQFVCRTWLSRISLWIFLLISTYGIILTALERYAAVIYPVWYKVRIRNFATMRMLKLKKLNLQLIGENQAKNWIHLGLKAIGLSSIRFAEDRPTLQRIVSASRAQGVILSYNKYVLWNAVSVPLLCSVCV